MYYINSLDNNQGLENTFIASQWDENALDLAQKNNLAQEENTFADLPEELPEHAAEDRKKEWAEAREFRRKTLEIFYWSYYLRAKHEITYQPDFPPNYLYTTAKIRGGKAKQALAGRDGKNLLLQSSNLHLGSFHMGHLGLSGAYAEAEVLWRPEVREAILERLLELYDGVPFKYKIELGAARGDDLGRVHVHTVADVPYNLRHLAYEGSEILKPITPGDEFKVFCYLSKPAIYYDVPSYALFLENNETKTGNLSKLSGYRNVKR